MIAAGAIAAFLALGYLGNQDMQDDQLAQDNYCDQVNTYIQTNGKSGWPNYDADRGRECHFQFKHHSQKNSKLIASAS